MRDKLRQYRQKAGLTQEELAKEIGISSPYYNQIENGRRGVKIDLAEVIAHVLGQKLGWPESAPWVEEIFFTSNSAQRQAKTQRKGGEGVG